MPQFLLIVGALLALVGLGSIAAGAPDWVLGLSLGATLIQSGTIAFVGGLILIGLGMVLYVLQDLMRRLESGMPAPAARPALEDRTARAQRPQPGRQSAPEGAPRPREQPAEVAGEQPPPREVPPGGEPPRARRERREAAPDLAADEFPSQEIPLGEPRPRRERPRDAHPEEIARPRRPNMPQPPGDELVRPRRAAAPIPFSGEEPARRPRSSEPSHEEIPRLRGERPREQRTEEPRRDFAPIPSIPQPFGAAEGRQGGGDSSESYLPKFRPAEPAPRSPGSDTVVRSGVIGGMAYTLYVDGSIEAELPIGTVRFNSIADLQDHVLRTGTEADADFDDSKR